jgi:putative acetyltransferase
MSIVETESTTAQAARINQVHRGTNLTVRLESGELDERRIVHSINEAAFGRPDEADLVDSLHCEGVVLASLVAVLHERVVGHILFSRMSIETPGRPTPSVALAPMAVLPQHQRQGIGGQLIRHGLDVLRQQGEQIVIVLGHPDYYPQFGFSCDKASFLESPFPRHAFMAMELNPGALDGIHGKVKYPAAFGL